MSDLVIRKEQFVTLTVLDHATGQVLSGPQEFDLGVPEIPNDRVSTQSQNIYFFDAPTGGRAGSLTLLP